MKPLNKLEKEMFEAIDAVPLRTLDDGQLIDDYEGYARAAAKVAVDLAKRAHNYAILTFSNEYPAVSAKIDFDKFLKSEGIETEK